jgi:hypothetical protein
LPLTLSLILRLQRKQKAGYEKEVAVMHVTDPMVKPMQDKRQCEILHRNSASYAKKAAKNDSYTHGIVKSMSLTFKGNGVY